LRAPGLQRKRRGAYRQQQHEQSIPQGVKYRIRCERVRIALNVTRNANAEMAHCCASARDFLLFENLDHQQRRCGIQGELAIEKRGPKTDPEQ
jgi:hypothetical protein